MHHTGRRWLSTRSVPETVVRAPKRMRELLGELREARDTGGKSSEVKKQAVGIRQLVRIRSSEFKQEIKKLSPDQYVQASLPQRIRDRFQGESPLDLVKTANQSPERQAELLLKEALTEVSESDMIEEFQDLDDVGIAQLNDYSTQIELRPGDLVEYWPDRGQRRTVLIIKLPDKSSGKRYVTLSDRGKIDFTNPNRFRFVIPEFYDGKKIDSSGIMLMSDPAFVPLRRALNNFKQQVATFTQAHARELQAIYASLPEKFTKEPSLVSVKDVCELLFKDVTNVSMYAVFESMTLDRLHFMPDPTLHMSVPIFTTRSSEFIKQTESVTSWIRTNSKEYKAFIGRAKKVISFGNTVCSDGQSLKAVKCPVHFTATDKFFIRFMVKSCLERIENSENEIYTIPVARIIKDLDLFPDRRVDRSLVHAALKKIGILTPWDSNLRRSPWAELPGYGSSALADEHEQYMHEEFPKSKIQSLSELGLTDRCSALRHDFGNLPVYAIDGENASELDDGISIDGDWLHVHIADPSSYIDPGTKIAEIAKFRVETCYLDDSIHPMLPLTLASRHFSLGASHVTPTMTTSVRINEAGEIVDLKIRPGIIRNVRKTTYEYVDDNVFNIAPKSYLVASLSSNWDSEWSQRSSRREGLTDFTAEDRENILKMHKFLKSAFLYRFNNGLMDFYNLDKSTLVQPSTLPSSLQEYSIPTFYAGRPGIKRVITSQSDSMARSLVAEAAILANRSITKFSVEHGIPIIYKGMRTNFTPEEKEYVMKSRDSAGRLQQVVSAQFMNKFGSSRMSLTPKPADMIGLPEGYTNATSPLRRYTDMVAQWQIQSYLRKEPYEIDLNELMSHLTRRGKALKQVQKASAKHWILQLLNQQAERGELQEFQATVLVNNALKNLPSEGTLNGVGEKCLIRREASDEVMEIGQKVKVKIDELDLMDNVIYVRRIKV